MQKQSSFACQQISCRLCKTSTLLLLVKEIERISFKLSADSVDPE